MQDPKTLAKLTPGEYYLIDFERLQIPKGSEGAERLKFFKLLREESAPVHAWRKIQPEAAVCRNEYSSAQAVTAGLEAHKENFPSHTFYITRGFNL